MAYIARRAAGLIPVWLLVAVFTFLLLHLAPGDPAALMLGPDAPQSAVLELRGRLGLDRPLVEQFVRWLGQMVRGDLGRSIFLAAPVSQLIQERLPVTASLALASLAVALGLGVPLGVWAALRPNSLRDLLVMLVSFAGISVPEFVLGLLLLIAFSVTLGWLPVGGYVPLAQGVVAWAQHLVLPALALGLVHAALIARMARATMLEVLNQEYIRSARAKGLASGKIIWKHAFRNVSLQMVTVTGITLAVLLGGAFITEVVFNLPGLGVLTVGAVERRDYPVVQGVMLVMATLVMVVNTFMDVLYGFVDPRVRL